MSELEDFREFLESCLAARIRDIERISRGRNSQAFRLILDDGRCCVAKRYFPYDLQGRDRLGVEYQGLRFLWERGIRAIPQPIAADTERSIAVYTHVPGEPPDLGSIQNADIDAAADFLIALNGLKASAGASELPAASEADFSLSEILSRIVGRIVRLEGLPEGGSLIQEMRQFLCDSFAPQWRLVERHALEEFELAGIAADEEILHDERTLSPSDFGFHNALRAADGALAFLDFEYFGWDDPVKTIVDFVLHPGMELPASLKQRFVERMLGHFGGNERFLRRLSGLYPVFGLKWCLILLNEFLPVDLERRRFASAEMETPEVLERRQLEQLVKARKMLNKVTNDYQPCPLFN